TRDVFQRADLFLDREHDLEGEINRFLDLVFGHPFHTPRRDEHGMFVAYAAALRSGDLSRQVGAALFSKTGELIAVGANDGPAPGGGLYWPGPNDERDWKQGFDWNERARERLVDGI